AAHAFRLQDSSVIKIAGDFMRHHGLWGSDLTATEIVDVGYGNRTSRETGRKIVVFHQTVRGLTVLDYGAAVEVTVAADGSVVSAQGALIDASMLRIPEMVDSGDVDVAKARGQALAALG